MKLRNAINKRYNKSMKSMKYEIINRLNIRGIDDEEYNFLFFSYLIDHRGWNKRKKDKTK